MIEREDLLALVDAVESATGRRPHVATVLRWASRGSAGVRLETVFVGGRRLTSAAAVTRFVNACTEARGAAVAITPPAQADRHAERSAQKLREMLEPKRKQRHL
jgi:hypothetical protein